jgi:Fe-S cluster assembly scaffold protein SufB
MHKQNDHNEIVDLSMHLTDVQITDKVIKVHKSRNYNYTAKLEGIQIKKKLTFQFTKSDITSDINFKLVLDSGSQIEIEAVIQVGNTIINCISNLSMQALILDDNSTIQFTPSLEINNQDVIVNHNSHIGKPDANHIEYLKSRGLTEEDAIQLIANSFLE